MATDSSIFVIVEASVRDRARFQREYVEPVLPILDRHGAELLAATEGAEVIEGERRGNRTVLLRFPSRESFSAWYDDPEYVPLRSKRMELTDPSRGTLIVVPGFSSPS